MRGSTPDGDVASLIARLAARAKAEIEAKRQETRAEIARLEHDAAEAQRLRREDALAECRARVEHEASVAVTAATLDARRELLDAQRTLIERVLGVASQRLPSLMDESHLSDALLASRVRNALTYVEGESAEVWCAPALAIRVKAIVASLAPHAGVLNDAAVGSGILVSDRARLTIEDTLEARLARLRPELGIEITHSAERPTEGT